MFYVDLNSDLGESFGNYTIGMDEEILQYVSSANVACGWHAGDPMVMDKTIALAKKYGTAVGAHPGFPDLMGFGRRNMVVTPEEAKAYLKYQLGALSAFTKSQGVKIQHVKPHGAFYNMAAVDEKLARAMCEAVYEVDKDIIFTPSATRVSRMFFTNSSAFGLSPCTQMESALMEMSFPLMLSTFPSFTILTTRLIARSLSLMTAPGSFLETRVPSSLYARSANTSLAACKPTSSAALIIWDPGSRGSGD